MERGLLNGLRAPLGFESGRREEDFMAAAKQHPKHRKLGSVSAREGMRANTDSARTDQLLSDLHLSGRSSLSDMAPGDIIFLDDFAYLRESFAPNFVAVLACPRCGAPSLITSVQYSRGAPIVCSSKVCSGLFRIVDEAQIVSLPPN
jgi:hypothetical protein